MTNALKLTIVTAINWMLVATSEFLFAFASVMAFWPVALYLRWLILDRVAKTRLQLGFLNWTKALALELLGCADKYLDDWNYGNAIHQGNILLGRVAMREHNVPLARQYLMKAARTPGSPQLNSFGPNMSLAKELLELGQTNAVLEYLKLCSEFWNAEFSQLERWTKDINSGLRPKFGPNLYY